ncbi:MAG: sigma-70 family RNA polymerase sigma factor [Planctomycetota bacterium]|nr:sigma-70 family RNA polymerase sigma factor [Planctomycetota bacterium]
MQDWDRILTEHAPAVWAAAYRLLGNAADADECMQEAFVAAVRADGRGGVRDWGAMLRWLVTKRGLDRLRRRLAEKASRGPAVWEALASAGEAPDARMQRAELADGLRAALGRLPDRHAQAFCLRHLEEMSYEDIAGQLQVSVNSVGVILNRARERLRELLKECALEKPK